MNWDFHHLGVACRSIEAERAMFEALGYDAEGSPFVDPLQGIEGQFLTGPGPRLELLVELPGSDVLSPWLSKGVKIYHQGFQVANLMESIDQLRSAGARTVSPPKPAVAFEGRPVTFLMLRNLFLVELIQAASPLLRVPPAQSNRE
jgi:hypothetical protein